LKSSVLQYRPAEADNRRLANLCGAVDDNLRQIEEAYDVRIARRADTFSVEGPGSQSKHAVRALEHFYRRADAPLSIEDIQLGLVELRTPGERRPASRDAGPRDAAPAAEAAPADDAPVLHTRRADLQGRTPRQREYLRNILSHDITFGIGPAGTGKTYLAVACAVDALERDAIKKIVLTRPAVEAGERLGFLPGDLAQKVDPYLRPLYDALYDLMGFDRVGKAFEKGQIEIAPLAFMRGRTLNHAFVILDEAQNTTREQMKMFLTRIGFGSRCVVTGDVSQVDLPAGMPSGLVDAELALRAVRGIAFTRFTAADVVRHPLVARIVEAYAAHEASPGPAPGARSPRRAA
jgi:phosphate starvation-inducible PhoH-like protein